MKARNSALQVSSGYRQPTLANTSQRQRRLDPSVSRPIVPRRPRPRRLQRRPPLGQRHRDISDIRSFCSSVVLFRWFRFRPLFPLVLHKVHLIASDSGMKSQPLLISNPPALPKSSSFYFTGQVFNRLQSCSRRRRFYVEQPRSTLSCSFQRRSAGRHRGALRMALQRHSDGMRCAG